MKKVVVPMQGEMLEVVQKTSQKPQSSLSAGFTGSVGIDMSRLDSLDRAKARSVVSTQRYHDDHHRLA